MILYNYDDALVKLKKWAKENPQVFAGFPRRPKRWGRLSIESSDWWKNVLASKKLPEEISNYFKAFCMFDDGGFFPEIAVTQTKEDREMRGMFDRSEGKNMFDKVMGSSNAIVLEKVFITNQTKDGRLTVWTFPLIRDDRQSYSFPTTIWMYTEPETGNEVCISTSPSIYCDETAKMLWQMVHCHSTSKPTSKLFASLRRMDKGAQEKEKSEKVQERVKKIYEFAEKKDVLADKLKQLRAIVDLNLQEIESLQPSRSSLKKLIKFNQKFHRQAMDFCQNPYCGEKPEDTEARLNVDITKDLPPKTHLKKKRRARNT